MCEQCEGIAARINFPTLRDFRLVAAQISAMVKRGSLRLVSEELPMEDVVFAKQLPDSFGNRFACTKCGEGFELWANFYHGFGKWTGALGE